MAEKKTGRIHEEFWLEEAYAETVGSTKRMNSVILCVVCCTAVVIASQFVAAEVAQNRFRQTLNEIEYGKVGGEANFRLLQEIQRDRTSTYLKDLEEKEPEYIRGIKRKIENSGQDATAKTSGKLTAEEVSAFRSTLPSGTGSEAETTIVEFSDFSCPFCKEYHESGTIGAVAKETSSDYALKILPNKKHEGSEFLAHAAKCVGQKSGTGAFAEFADAVFSSTGSASESAYASAEKSWLSKVELETCVQSAAVNDLVAKDLGQGMYLKIHATPSVLVLDNATGKYVLIKGEPDSASLKSAIEESSAKDE